MFEVLSLIFVGQICFPFYVENMMTRHEFGEESKLGRTTQLENIKTVEHTLTKQFIR